MMGNNKLFWKIALTLLGVVLFIGTLMSYISVKSSLEYSSEVNQRLNWWLAQNIVDEIKPSFQDGEVDQASVKKIISSAMAINPNIEVYLVNPEGLILSFVSMAKDVTQQNIDLGPVKNFIQGESQGCVMGTNPRNIKKPKVFSAAPVLENGEITGYVYVILGSEDLDSVMSHMSGSYILKVGIRNMIISMVAAFLLGLLGFWFITQKLKVIMDSLRRFKEGNLGTRIQINDNGEFKELATTFNEMADTMENNIEDLKGVERLRRDLIANVSHDLRTPIASIQGYLETLILKNEDLTNDKKSEYVQVALNNTERLKKLVDDLFDLSRLEAKERSLVLEPMSMAELVHDVANKYRLIANDKGIHINTMLSKSIPLVEADVALIDRVLQNLIDNAIKFCKKGDTINIELVESDSKVRVRIVDTGIGICQKQMPYIFDRYQKSTVANNKNGTGLGLAIAKKIIELHESEILVESELDKGCTFAFNLPIYKRS